MQTYTDLIQQQARLAGVLLHPTSLPSGKLDKDAFLWLDIMAEAGLSVWQVLPLGVPQQNLSPYQCYSAFAMNPALLAHSDYAHQDVTQPDYLQWLAKEMYWLEDYALFMVLKNHHKQRAWNEWPEEYKQRHHVALARFCDENKTEINAIYWQQYCLYTRWNALSVYAHERNILLLGDMPIFVAYDSADVWCHPESFLLDASGNATVVAGVPPDYFSATGQRWGNPHYNWEQMETDDFSWWLSRIHNHLSLFDLVRIDHFRGLEAAWAIPSSCETAIEGEWKQTPGDKLLSKLQQVMGQIPIVAEDLGIITPEVNALREKFQLPGMSVLQFSFDGFDDNPHKPKNITYDRIVYTGTHDNNTTRGWFNEQDGGMQHFIRESLAIDYEADVVEAIIDSALQSKGQLVVVPLQDFLGLGADARMNIPGVSEGNWTWQLAWDDLPQDLTRHLKQKLLESERLLTVSKPE